MALSSTASFGAEAFFYIGTSAGRDSGGIYAGRLDLQTGKLIGPPVLAVQAHDSNFLALLPDGKFLYSAIAPGKGAAGAFKVERGGALTPLNQQPSGGGETCHAGVDATGRNLLVANYNGGSIACLRITPEGSLGERTAFIEFSGSGPDPKRQTKPYPHSIYVDPANRFAYVCDLGTDKVHIFEFDAAHGTLIPAKPAAGHVPPGSGPRHLAFHSKGHFAYVCNEMGLDVTAFARDPESGALTPLQTVPILPDPAALPPLRGSATVAEVACHPSGKWLYVSTRGPDSITVYAIKADGTLAFIENTPAQVKVPRSFAIDPSGHWLIAAGQQDHKIAVLKIDQETGKLTATDQQAVGLGNPVCVLFATTPPPSPVPASR